MAFNELFRLVSLRQTKASTENGVAHTDRRVQHSSWIRDQLAVRPPPRDTLLADLRKRQAELSARCEHFEAIQRVAMRMHLADSSAPPSVSTRVATEARKTSVPLASAVPPSNVIDTAALSDRVKQRLGSSALEALKTGMGALASETHIEPSDLLVALDTGPLYGELNHVCAQIHELDVPGIGLPTIGSVEHNNTPLVAAIGWGDLVVARESLVGYDAKEIAHIENVLPGESKVRVHERIATTEEFNESETISERESEKDSQTTDRYELQAESQSTIAQDFSISTGVNTSGQYGLTQVDTSLDAAFSQSESQSRSSSVDTAKEIVSKAVERTFERVRQLRRLTIKERIRELNRHKLSNVGPQSDGSAISGIYLFVEKIQKIELRHYGTRMMIEFHVPEPALTLLERAAAGEFSASLPPFDVYPGDIQPGNYLCEAQQYNALDITPPPSLFIQVGWSWNSKIFEEAEQWGEDCFSDIINIPKGYRPMAARVAWSGLRGKTENREFNFSFAVGGRSEEGHEHTIPTYDGVVLQLRADADWPQGVPVSGRVHGSWDGAMYVHVTLSCMRTNEALDAWRISVWQALQAGYETIERKFAQKQQQKNYQKEILRAVGSNAPSSEYRRVERAELQKWAIKSMRRAPQNFNAVEQVGDLQEIEPQSAEAQAPIVRFYEDSFEWEHMTYFLYPYHWSRRASWASRIAAEAAEAQHQAFLSAGAARVIVPIKPGFEEKVASFLDPDNPITGELERILSPSQSTPPPDDGEFRNLWTELLTEHRPDLARGSGTLAVTNGSTEVIIGGNSNWRVTAERDEGRELHIAGEQYTVAHVLDETTFRIDRPYAGASDSAAVYVAGSTPFGPPWTVNVPTTLVILAENLPALQNIGS
jgi:hypothetical protein